MGNYVIKMPDLGEGIAEVEVVAWRVQPGDAVKEDQVLADVMTDKATVEIPSPVHGTVTALGGKVGESLAVGAALIRLQVEGKGNVAPGAQQDGAQQAGAQEAGAQAGAVAEAASPVDLAPNRVGPDMGPKSAPDIGGSLQAQPAAASNAGTSAPASTPARPAHGAGSAPSRGTPPQRPAALRAEG